MFIGRDGENISLDEAEEFVFGYAIFNDFSARDLQFDESQLGFGPAKLRALMGQTQLDLG